jgi:hypothetical protein
MPKSDRPESKKRMNRSCCAYGFSLISVAEPPRKQHSLWTSRSGYVSTVTVVCGAVNRSSTVVGWSSSSPTPRHASRHNILIVCVPRSLAPSLVRDLCVCVCGCCVIGNYGWLRLGTYGLVARSRPHFFGEWDCCSCSYNSRHGATSQAPSSPISNTYCDIH